MREHHGVCGGVLKEGFQPKVVLRELIYNVPLQHKCPAASHLWRWKRVVCMSGFMASAHVMGFNQRCMFGDHTRVGPVHRNDPPTWSSSWLTGPPHLIISPLLNWKGGIFTMNGASCNQWRATQVVRKIKVSLSLQSCLLSTNSH